MQLTYCLPSESTTTGATNINSKLLSIPLCHLCAPLDTMRKLQQLRLREG